MGDVIDFRSYSDDKVLLVMNKPCPRPFHNEEYVKNHNCSRCGVSVKLTNHPSFGKEKWYG